MKIVSPDRDQLVTFITENISDCAKLDTVDLILEEVKNGFTEVRIRGNRVVASKPMVVSKTASGSVTNVAGEVSKNDYFVLSHERLCLIVKIARQVYNWVKRKWFS